MHFSRNIKEGILKHIPLKHRQDSYNIFAIDYLYKNNHLNHNKDFDISMNIIDNIAHIVIEYNNLYQYYQFNMRNYDILKKEEFLDRGNLLTYLIKNNIYKYLGA